jgi:hypothetical protein
MKLTKLRATGALIAFAIVAALGLSSAVQAAPAPLNPPSQPVAPTAKIVTFASLQRITANGRVSTIAVPQYGALDLQYVVDAADGANPFTATVEYSNDATNWVRNTAAAWSNTAATTGTTDMTRTHLYGAFATVYVSVTNSTPITLSLVGLVK